MYLLQSALDPPYFQRRRRGSLRRVREHILRFSEEDKETVIVIHPPRLGGLVVLGDFLPGFDGANPSYGPYRSPH